MGQISLGMNLEATRHHDKPFEWGLDRAAEMGYEYVEPMVHFGRELMSEAGYYHTVSLFNDPLVMRKMCEDRGLKISALQAHGPICRPDYHGEYLKMAIRYAAECGAPVVNTDEGIKAPWTTEAEDHVLMRYTLVRSGPVAEPRGVKIGLECHSQYSRTPTASTASTTWCPRRPSASTSTPATPTSPARTRTHGSNGSSNGLVHLHAKDISDEHSVAERGKVSGTPVGCACGDGVIDWRRMIDICEPLSA